MRELARLFLKLGFIGFGGPAAHIALMHDEVVRRRQWLTEPDFLDLVGATNLLPGPNSTELAMHIGYRRARWRGLVVAGVCFIAPAAVMVTALAWAYVRYGQTPTGASLRYGIFPVVLAIIGYAVVGLARTAVRGWWYAGLGLLALGAYLVGVNEVLILAGGAAMCVLVRLRRPSLLLFLVPPPSATTPELTRLFLIMLKIGSVLFGSGYVLYAFLHGDFVVRLGWLTEAQLLDAVTVGQITPGPLFTSATFVGYLVGGVPGAIVATVAIFLPAFVLSGLLGRLVGWLRARWWSSAALDGINATAVALMAGVAAQLGGSALVDPLTVGLAGAAVAVLIRWRVNPAWLILAGAAVGLIRAVLSGSLSL